MSRTTWPAARAADSLATVETRNNRAGLAKERERQENQTYENALANMFGRAARPIVWARSFEDEPTTADIRKAAEMPGAGLKSMAAARVRREQRKAGL